MLPGVPGQLVLHPCARVPVRHDYQIYQNIYMSNHTDQEYHNGQKVPIPSHEKRNAYNFQTQLIFIWVLVIQKGDMNNDET